MGTSPFGPLSPPLLLIRGMELINLVQTEINICFQNFNWFVNFLNQIKL
jgi:hypothetical protein